MRQIRMYGSMRGRWRRGRVRLVRHRQPKGPATAWHHLTYRATSLLYCFLRQYSSGRSTVVRPLLSKQVMTHSRLPREVVYSLITRSRRLSRLLLLIVPESSVASHPRRRSSAVSGISSQ
jgi:hypothetical protein